MKIVAKAAAKITNRQLLKALILSFLSLLGCIAMFSGTTYAWLTDSVTSGKNRIVSGALDVDMYYSQNMSDWENVADHAGDDLLTTEYWEPGVAEVLYLRVENAGSQSLTYDFFVSAGDLKTGLSAETGLEYRLSELLRYGVVAMDGQAPFADAPTALAALGEAHKTLNQFFKANESVLAPGQSAQYALIIFMPEDETTAEANPLTTAVPRVELGISLRARQTGGEGDAFDDQYDATAGYDNQFTVLVNTDTDGITTQEATVYDGTAQLVIPAGTKLKTYEDGKGSISLRLFKITATAEPEPGEAVEGYLISALGAADDNTVPMEFSMDMPDLAGGTVLRVLKNEALFEGWVYDAQANRLVLTDTAFGTVQVVTGHITADNINALLSRRSEWTLTDDITMPQNTALVLPEGALLHLNGHTLTLSLNATAENEAYAALDVQGNATVEGGRLLINATATEPGDKANLSAAQIPEGKQLALNELTLNHDLEFGERVVKTAVVYE